MWNKEEEFLELLKRIGKKATKENLEHLARLAVDEENQGYKHVCALLVRELKVLKPQYRLRVFYALSAVLRLSVKERGSRDKYVDRLAPQLGTIGELLAEAPAEHQQQMQKVLAQWWHEGVFPALAVHELQQRLGGAPPSMGPALPETASASGALLEAAAAGTGPAAVPASTTAESSGAIPGMHSPMSLPAQQSGAASAEGSRSAGGAVGAGGGTDAGAASQPPQQPPPQQQQPAGRSRSRVEWGAAARGRQATSVRSAPTAASTGAEAGSLPHSDSSHKLPQAATGPMPPPPLPPTSLQPPAQAGAPLPPQPEHAHAAAPQHQGQQAEEEEYDPLTAADALGQSVGCQPLAGGDLPLPPAHLPPPPSAGPPFPPHIPQRSPLPPPPPLPSAPAEQPQPTTAPWAQPSHPPLPPGTAPPLQQQHQGPWVAPAAPAAAMPAGVPDGGEAPGEQGVGTGGRPPPQPPSEQQQQQPPPQQQQQCTEAPRKRRSRWEEGEGGGGIGASAGLPPAPTTQPEGLPAQGASGGSEARPKQRSRWEGS